jgi:hypothetical protein
MPLALPALFEALGTEARDAVVLVAGNDAVQPLAVARATKKKILPERILGNQTRRPSVGLAAPPWSRTRR